MHSTEQYMPPASRSSVPHGVSGTWRPGVLDAATGRRALAGFFLSGVLFSFLGAILPAWGYHLRSDYITIGEFFLALNCGIVCSIRVSQILLPRKGTSFVLTLASAVACLALLYLSFVSGSVPAWERLLGLLLVGFSTGLLNTAVFHAITPLYQHDPAATVNLAGALFSLGCLLTAILVAGTFYVYNVQSILILLATLPALFAVGYSRTRFAAARKLKFPSLREAVQDFKSPGAVLFTLLLFFQFGNEWAIAGWLPLYLIQRLGISPESSLWLLAFYWTALILGRILVQTVMRKMSHTKLLLISVLGALCGCIILAATNNLTGAYAGILLTGSGFAAIYPLTVENIGHRFPYYHPGFYNSIFSLGLTGGLMAPFALGFASQFWGLGMVMLLPSIGTCMVFVLVLLIWLEARLSRPAESSA
jgi:FHS family glucose/mannose:H+ symporter-like MFS transporter